MNEYERQYRLQQHAGRVQGALDSSNGMIDFSKMALRGAMLLNGAGVIPIIYSKVEWLFPVAITFGVGALFAAIATSMAYLTQWALFCTWKEAIFGGVLKTEYVDEGAGKVEVRVLTEAVSKKVLFLSDACRCLAMLCLALSVGAFAVGLWQAHHALAAQPQTTRQEPPQQVSILSLQQPGVHASSGILSHTHIQPHHT